MKTTVVGMLLLALAGCGNGDVSVADLQAKCMRACQRNNSTCGRTEDCSSDCTINTAAMPVCLNEGGALFDCVNGLSDADLCANTDTACASQERTFDQCLSGTNDGDAGATHDTGTP